MKSIEKEKQLEKVLSEFSTSLKPSNEWLSNTKKQLLERYSNDKKYQISRKIDVFFVKMVQSKWAVLSLVAIIPLFIVTLAPIVNKAYPGSWLYGVEKGYETVGIGYEKYFGTDYSLAKKYIAQSTERVYELEVIRKQYDNQSDLFEENIFLAEVNQLLLDYKESLNNAHSIVTSAENDLSEDESEEILLLTSDLISKTENVVWDLQMNYAFQSSIVEEIGAFNQEIVEISFNWLVKKYKAKNSINNEKMLEILNHSLSSLISDQKRFEQKVSFYSDIVEPIVQDQITINLDEFDSSIEEARKEISSGDSAEAIKTLEHAFELRKEIDSLFSPVEDARNLKKEAEQQIKKIEEIIQRGSDSISPDLMNIYTLTRTSFNNENYLQTLNYAEQFQELYDARTNEKTGKTSTNSSNKPANAAENDKGTSTSSKDKKKDKKQNEKLQDQSERESSESSVSPSSEGSSSSSISSSPVSEEESSSAESFLGTDNTNDSLPDEDEEPEFPQPFFVWWWRHGSDYRR